MYRIVTTQHLDRYSVSTVSHITNVLSVHRFVLEYGMMQKANEAFTIG